MVQFNDALNFCSDGQINYGKLKNNGNNIVHKYFKTSTKGGYKSIDIGKYCTKY